MTPRSVVEFCSEQLRVMRGEISKLEMMLDELSVTIVENAAAAGGEPATNKTSRSHATT